MLVLRDENENYVAFNWDSSNIFYSLIFKKLLRKKTPQGRHHHFLSLEDFKAFLFKYAVNIIKFMFIEEFELSKIRL